MPNEKLGEIMNYGLEDQGGCSSCDREDGSDDEVSDAKCGFCRDLKNCNYCFSHNECWGRCTTKGYSGFLLDSCIVGCDGSSGYCCSGPDELLLQW